MYCSNKKRPKTRNDSAIVISRFKIRRQRYGNFDDTMICEDVYHFFFILRILEEFTQTFGVHRGSFLVHQKDLLVHLQTFGVHNQIIK
ncbi:MAG: hypothetical protein LBP63_02450 [Prevotellaceae bacterium]|nr:hypothetical protein [Prevotellaceae bacterium]